MTKKLLAAVIAVAVLAVVVAGCGSGGGVPDDSVATIDGTSIKKTDFEHWMTIAAKQQAVPGTAAAAPDPPTYAKCVAALQKQPVAKGQAKPTVAALKAQCAQQYDGLKTQVMQFLIQSQWLLQEASARKLTAKPATVQKQLDDQIKQSFPKQADFQNFLKSSGMSMQDLLFRVKIDVLTQQVRQKIVAEIPAGRLAMPAAPLLPRDELPNVIDVSPQAVDSVRERSANLHPVDRFVDPIEFL